MVRLFTRRMVLLFTILLLLLLILSCYLKDLNIVVVAFG
jgi:hypothetical protein